MLFSFLIGIAIGSAVVQRFLRRIDVVAALGLVELALAGALVLQVHGFTRFVDLLFALAKLFASAGVYSPFPAMLTASLLMLVIPTALMGAAFPLTVRLYEMSASRGEARSVGKVYLANTIGSISGSMLAGFVLVRLIGSQYGLFLMALSISRSAHGFCASGSRSASP